MSKLLVVDDDAGILDGVCTLLEENYEIVTARNGEEALARFSEHSIDLVLLDLLMPKLDGPGFIKAISGSNPRMPIIVMTASPNYETFLKGLEISELIRKPFDIQELERMISNHLKIQRKRPAEVFIRPGTFQAS